MSVWVILKLNVEDHSLEDKWFEEGLQLWFDLCVQNQEVGEHNASDEGYVDTLPSSLYFLEWIGEKIVDYATELPGWSEESPQVYVESTFALDESDPPFC